MTANTELQELYALVARVVDGYNRTHRAQVSYLDFTADVPGDEAPYSGSLVFRDYRPNVIEQDYRELTEDDNDWYGPEDWDAVARASAVEVIRRDRRKESQRRHREGLGLDTLWYVRLRDCDSPFPYSINSL